MARKRREYFVSGVQLVWLVDPDRRTVTVCKSPDESTVLTEADTLDGGTVLPGLELPVRRIFERVPVALGSTRKKKRPHGKRNKGSAS
jgi:Uma2 family endonuclease